jgi:uncharacterized small protein (DUF1192 family)
MENKPTEIWIDTLAMSQGKMCDYIGTSQQTIDDVKYVSAAHHAKIVSELDDEVHELAMSRFELNVEILKLKEEIERLKTELLLQRNLFKNANREDI